MSVFENPQFFLDLFKRWNTYEYGPKYNMCAVVLDGETYEICMNFTYRRHLPSTFASFVELRFFIHGLFEFGCTYKVSEHDSGYLPPDGSPFILSNLSLNKNYSGEEIEYILMMAMLAGEMTE